ncbi:MAG TPA: DUF4160 domain-containing protein [Phycisphaerae bacterium]|nr:DUF4160 domain-containing protein [Phycisphaerae bacterium]
MPTVLRAKGYRFFFSADRPEAPHIHVEKGEGYAKFWLEPVAVAQSRGFASHELTEIARIVARNRRFLREKWNEHFAG